MPDTPILQKGMNNIPAPTSLPATTDTGSNPPYIYRPPMGPDMGKTSLAQAAIQGLVGQR